MALTGNANGGLARFINNDSFVDFSGSKGPAGDGQLTAGSIEGSGFFYLGANRLTVGGNNLSTIVTGTISDCGPFGVLCNAAAGDHTGGSLVKTGAGILTLDGANTYTGSTEVQQGIMVVGDANTPTAGIAGPAQVDGGAMLLGYGTIGGNLVNNGTVIPGGSALIAALSHDAFHPTIPTGPLPGIGTLAVNGNYTQGVAGNLVIGVTPTASSLLAVKGAASLAGGVSFIYAPGSYAARSYTFLHATGGVARSFLSASESGSIPDLPSRSVIYTQNDADLVLGTPPVAPGPSPAVAQAVAPNDGALFSAKYSSVMRLADQATRLALFEAGQGGGQRSALPFRFAASDPSVLTTDAAGAARSLVSGTSLWIHANGAFGSVGDPTSAPGYSADAVGFLAGFDRAVTPGGLQLGVAFGYDHGWLGDDLGGAAAAEIGRIGVYGSQPLGPARLEGAVLYSHDWGWTHRQTGVGTATASNTGNGLSGGLQAGVALAVQEFVISPAAGVRFGWLGEGSFAESGLGLPVGFAVTGSATNFATVVPFVGVGGAREYVSSSGLVVSPYARVGWDYLGGNNNPAVLLAAADGTLFPTGSVPLDRNSAALGAGVNFGRGNWSLFAHYDAHLAGNWRAQEVKLGMRLAF